MRYDFASIEQRWQRRWADQKTFRAANPAPGIEATSKPVKPKYYVLDMFPYPSGVGLHVGHPLGYIATDIVARHKRMLGFDVLHPMGFDAFGLPAEQFAVEHGVHPAVTTQKNIDNMVRQLKSMGLSYDWDRSLSTTDVDYYKWTQWIFLQLFNSYFDPVELKAKPIDALLHALAGERYLIDSSGELVQAAADDDLQAIAGVPLGLRIWAELDETQRQQVIDEQRLAYLAQVPVNWCPALGTVLANEEVTADGKSERGNHPVFKRPLKQWMLRITKYADRLESELEPVDWPEPIKMMQRNWIGRSQGARVVFELATEISTTDDTLDTSITVFTTRPDTLFGATYMVLAPEHPLVESITTETQRAAVNQYRAITASKSDVDRQSEATSGKKSGVFTGAFAINPVNNQQIPIWIADYVMMGYGTGAIMAVPAHDERDFAFAKHFALPIRTVVAPAGQPDFLVTDTPFCESGMAVNSSSDAVSIEGLLTDEAKKTITRWLSDESVGEATVQYKLRDWLFSRQRYWGEPFPILHGPDGEIVALDASELPVELPAMEDFRPTASNDPDAPPQPPLARAPESWKYVMRDGKRYTREFNTMPQWAGSCWYYLRFCDNKNADAFVGTDAERKWMVSPRKSNTSAKPGDAWTESGHHFGGVDLYVGGAEHAVLHLLYARFWHKVLFDLGHVSTPEPFGKLFNQGYIQAYAYTDSRGVYVPAAEVVERDGKFFYQDQPVKQEFGKMGKSLKNSVTPDEVCEQYGCDTLRLYEMYLGPLDQSKVWRTRDITGMHNFLKRLWRNFVDEETGRLRVTDELPTTELRRLLHKTIKKVSDDMDRMSFNTAIAALIELNNELVSQQSIPQEVARAMTLLLSPLAPHVAEELWERQGNSKTLAYEAWPSYDPALLVEDSVEYPIQVSGKLRSKITVPATADQAAIETAALADEKTQAAIAGKPVKKIIVVRGRMVNVIV
jgi:leucyl-tRNA synthetase